MTLKEKVTIPLQPYGRLISTLFQWKPSPDTANSLFAAAHQHAREIIRHDARWVLANEAVIDLEIENESGVIFLQVISLTGLPANTVMIQIGFGQQNSIGDHHCENFNAAWYLMCALLARLENLHCLRWTPKSVYCTDEDWKLIHQQYNAFRKESAQALVLRTEMTRCGNLRWSFGNDTHGISLLVQVDASQALSNSIPSVFPSIELSLANAWGLLSYLSFIEEIPYGSLHVENDYADRVEIGDIWIQHFQPGQEWIDYFSEFSCITEET